MLSVQSVHTRPEGDGAFSSLAFGLSPCPNDTFIFYALLHGKIPLPCDLVPYMADVEELNRKVFSGELELSKVSYHLLGHVFDKYVLLRSGSALGRACGPILVSRDKMTYRQIVEGPVAVPGEFTTAALLLRLYAPDIQRLVPMHFARIPEAVASGQAASGVIIHETRFTYGQLGLTRVEDLGEWWEGETGLPIPLGGIIARRSLGRKLLKGLETAIAASVRFALENPNATLKFVRDHAQEISEDVLKRHISLYVNKFTMDLGDEGIRAVEHLLRLGFEKGIFSRLPGGEIPLSLPL